MVLQRRSTTLSRVSNTSFWSRVSATQPEFALLDSFPVSPVEYKTVRYYSVLQAIWTCAKWPHHNKASLNLKHESHILFCGKPQVPDLAVSFFGGSDCLIACFVRVLTLRHYFSPSMAMQNTINLTAADRMSNRFFIGSPDLGYHKQWTLSNFSKNGFRIAISSSQLIFRRMPP